MEMRFLIVDDNPDDVFFLEEKIRNDITGSLEIESCESIKDALQYTAEKTYTLIFLDLNIIGSNGMKTFETMKEHTDIPLIIVTGQYDKSIAIQAIKNGAYEYIVKSDLNTIDFSNILKRTIHAEDAVQSGSLVEQLPIFNAAPVKMFIVNKDARVVYANTKAQKLYTICPDEFGTRFFGCMLKCAYAVNEQCQISKECESCALRNMVHDVLKTHVEYTDFLVEIHSHSITSQYLISVAPIEMDGEKYALISVETSTTGERLEQAVLSSMQNFKNIVDNIFDAIIVVDKNSVVHYINEKARNIFADTVINGELFEYYELFHHEECSVTINEQQYFLQVQKCDIMWEEKPAEAIIIHDMTHQKREEQQKKKIERQLFHTQKMESFGQITGGVAHDFKNMLMPILFYSEQLKSKFDPDSKEYNQLQQMHKAAEQAEALTKQLLTFSRDEKTETAELDLGEIAEKYLPLAEKAVQRTSSIIYNSSENLKHIMGNENQICQIIMNLCINASHAMDDSKKGRIEVQVENCNVFEGNTQYPFVEPGDYVLLTVSDNGSGIPGEHLEHIFEPFFSTKEKGKGTGLGLAVVYGIVKQHKGYIKVNSSTSGTVFSIFFPCTSQEISFSDTSNADNLHIAVVDDDPLVLRLMNSALKMKNYNVHAYTSAQEMLQHVSEGKFHPDLLIADVIMPEDQISILSC